MIGWLSGTVRSFSGDRVVLDVGGVGYEVLVPAQLLPGVVGGEKLELHIHTHVREDALTLFGFPNLRDREFFLLLMTVSGVGAKTALGILSAMRTEQLVDAIRSGNAALLRSTPGIGKKTAERLLLELKDKVGSIALGPDAAVSAMPRTTQHEDLISALVNLGYRKSDAEYAVARVDLTKIESFDRMIKETLKILTR